MLSIHNYRVLHTESAKEALEILQTETIDLLLTDVIMPEIDDYQLASQVATKYPETKILITSGYNKDATIQENNEFTYPQLAKPYNSLSLLKSVRELLDS